LIAFALTLIEQTRLAVVERAILRLADVAADEMDCDLESSGSTTFKEESFAKGAEPDTCFYVQHAVRVAGKEMEMRGRSVNVLSQPLANESSPRLLPPFGHIERPGIEMPQPLPPRSARIYVDATTTAPCASGPMPRLSSNAKRATNAAASAN